MSIFHPGSEYRQESLKTILFFFPPLFNTGKPLLRYKTDLKTDCMRVAQFSKKINTEFTLETFQQYFPIKRHWNERERDTPGRASANETDEWSHARTHQAHNDFEHRGSKVIYRRVVRRLISNEKERENWKKKGEKMGEKVGWRAGNSRNPAQYRGNFSAGRIRNLEILSNWIISLAERSNCNRAYQSAISHRSSDYHNSRNSGIVSPWYRSISRYTSSYVCTCVRFACRGSLGNEFWKKKKGIQRRYAISPAVDLDPATSSRESVSRGTGKDLVTIGIFRLSSLRDAYPDTNRESWQLLEFPRKGSDDPISHFSMFLAIYKFKSL